MLRQGLAGSLNDEALETLLGERIERYRQVGNTTAIKGTEEWRKAARALCVSELEFLARAYERAMKATLPGSLKTLSFLKLKQIRSRMRSQRPSLTPSPSRTSGGWARSDIHTDTSIRRAWLPKILPEATFAIFRLARNWREFDGGLWLCSK